MKIELIKKNINKYIIIGLSVYIIFFLATSLEKIIEFRYEFFLIALILSFLNYMIRLFRWKYYLSNVGIKSRLNNVIFFSGLSMTITPGKFGELFKSYLLKRSDNIPIGKTSAIVFAERISDVFGMFILCLLGSLGMISKFWVLFIIILIMLIMLLFLNNDVIYKKIKKFIFRYRVIKKLEGFADEFRCGMKTLFSKKNAAYSLMLTTIGWMSEGIGLWFILLGFGINADVTNIVFIYALSSLIGSISFIPGGVAVTEGSMFWLLSSIGIDGKIALSSTMLIRLATLWFGVIIGVIALWVYEKRIKNYNS